MRWAKDAFYEKGAYGLPRADRIQTPFLRIPEPSFPDSKRFVSDYQHASAYWHNPPPTMPPPTMPTVASPSGHYCVRAHSSLAVPLAASSRCRCPQNGSSHTCARTRQNRDFSRNQDTCIAHMLA